MTPTEAAVWNEANRRARASYDREPLAASREMAQGDATGDYMNGQLTLDELVQVRREIRSW